MTLADLQTAVEHEPDDSRAVEVASDALLSNPLELMFEIMDEEAAENARAPCCARANWAKAFAEFARSERIDSSTSFKYAKLSHAHPHEFKRERKLLAEKPWLYFGRCWPYTVQPMRGDPALWLPLGREYKPLGQDQFGGESHRYEDFASIAWRFSNCDPLAIEGVWPRTPGYLYNDGLDSRRGYFERLGRLISNADDPVECVRRLMLAWRSSYPPPPRGAGAKPRRDAPSPGGVAMKPLAGASPATLAA
jgi:hypothetical protein